MNKIRRELLRGLIGRLSIVSEELEDLRDGEQEALDNMPENLEGSDRYSLMEDAVDFMDSALDSISAAMDDMNAVLS
jgi:hypothetical protein